MTNLDTVVDELFESAIQDYANEWFSYSDVYAAQEKVKSAIRAALDDRFEAGRQFGMQQAEAMQNLARNAGELGLDY